MCCLSVFCVYVTCFISRCCMTGLLDLRNKCMYIQYLCMYVCMYVCICMHECVVVTPYVPSPISIILHPHSQRPEQRAWSHKPKKTRPKVFGAPVDFSLVVGWMPGYNSKDGARPAFPLRHGGFTEMPAHRRIFLNRDCATLGSNPIKRPNKSMPPPPPISVEIIKLQTSNAGNPLAQAKPLLELCLLTRPAMRSNAIMVKRTKGRRLALRAKSPPLVSPFVWLVWGTTLSLTIKE
jgi:hypothetical protein